MSQHPMQTTLFNECQLEKSSIDLQSLIGFFFANWEGNMHAFQGEREKYQRLNMYPWEHHGYYKHSRPGKFLTRSQAALSARILLFS